MLYYMALVFHLVLTPMFWKVFATAFVCFFLAIFLYVAYTHRRYDHIPGPKRGSFWLGHFCSLYNCLGNNNVVSKYLYENVKNFGHTVRFFMFHRPFVVVVDPKAVNDIMTPGKHQRCTTTCKQDGYIYGARWQGSGLLTDYNDARLQQRVSIFEPVFQHENLKAYLPDINCICDKVVSEFEFLADGKTLVSMSQQFERAMFDILCKVFFDKEMNSILCQRDIIRQAVFSLLSSRRHEKTDPWSNVSYFQRDVRQCARSACALLRKTGSEWIEERKERQMKGQTKPSDVLTKLIELSKVPGFSKEDVLDDFMVFMITTLERAPNVLSFLIRDAFRKSEVCEKLVEEVDRVMKGKTVVDSQCLDSLLYTEATFCETLRMYPSDVEIVRILSSEVTSKGCKLPPGTPVILSPLLSGRDETHFDDPMNFDPERFLTNGHSFPESSVYFPYVDDINEKLNRLGRMAMKVLLVKMTQKLKVHVFPDQNFAETNLPTLRPTRGGVAVFSPRFAKDKYIYDLSIKEWREQF